MSKKVIYRDWRDQFQLLKKKQTQIELDLMNFMKYNKKVNQVKELCKSKQQWEKILYEENKMNEERFQENKKISDQIFDLKEKKKLFMKGKVQSNELEILAENLQIKISGLKNSNKKIENDLRNQEENLQQEIDYLREQLGVFEFKEKLKKKKIVHQEQEIEEVTEQQEIKQQIWQRDQEIQILGGKNCGWLEEEQDDFVKILIKNKNNLDSKIFRQQIEKCFPLFNDTELDLHIENYRKYIRLEKEKKILLQKYKILQNQKMEEELKEIDDEVENQNQNKKDFKSQVEREEMKKQINQWKQQKEVEMFIKNEEEKEMQRIQQERLKKEKERLKQERDKKMKEIEEFKKIKKEKERRKSSKQQVQLSQKTLLRIQQKEQDMLEKKQELLLRKKFQQEEKQRKMAEFQRKKQEQFKELESKFTNETKAHVQKQRDKFVYGKDQPKQADNFAGVLVRTTGRRLISWRNNQILFYQINEKRFWLDKKFQNSIEIEKVVGDSLEIIIYQFVNAQRKFAVFLDLKKQFAKKQAKLLQIIQSQLDCQQI